MKYEVIIGLEVHVQSKNETKMFCSCSAKYFGAKPNTHVCAVCLGLPGALPVPNKHALDLAVRTSLALNCAINKVTKFDRKNYFYPDLAKGFQISQYDQPIGENGYIEIETVAGVKKIGITRVHQEEDTGKSIHDSGKTLLDFNKSGVALVEIVSEPDMRSKEEVTAYAKALKLLIQYLGVSDADMEKGQMRFEVNMSLRPEGQTELPNYKVEVKNIGSISVLEKVIDSEYKRQSEILDNGEVPKQETRGLVDMNGKTQSQRSKETSADYRYFPEPDIPPITFDDAYLENVKKSLPQLAPALKKRLQDETSLNAEVLDILVGDLRLVSILNQMDIKQELKADFIKWLTGEYLAFINTTEPHKDFVPTYLLTVIEMLNAKKITRDGAKQILVVSLTDGKAPEALATEMNLEIITDTGAIDTVIESIITANEKAVTDFKSGKNPNAVMFLVGQVMKEMRGRANAKEVEEKIKQKLTA